MPTASPKIAVIRREDIFAANERHGRAGLDRLMPFAAERKRNFALAVELKSAIVELTLHEHIAEDRFELIVREAMPVQTSRG